MQNFILLDKFKPLLALLLLALVAYGQQQKRIAIINTVDDGEPPIGFLELSHLTDKLREIANKTLPQKSYAVMTQQSMIAYLGSHEAMVKKCREAEGCLAKLGREIQADYVGQGRIGRFGEDYTIKVELYDSRNGNLISSFTGSSPNVYGLLSVLDNETPAMFKNTFAEGISGLKSAADYEPDYVKRYLVNLVTEPEGAALSFDGEPIAGCIQTPCKAELAEGEVRIVAALEQYERTDTTAFIQHNNQNIVIKMKPNFGVLEIKTAYQSDTGQYERLNLTVNDKDAYVGEKSWRWSSFFTALACDIIGAAFIYYGYTKEKEATKKYDEYSSLNRSNAQAEFDNAWEKLEKTREARDIFYLAGGGALILGIGIHIWF